MVPLNPCTMKKRLTLSVLSVFLLSLAYIGCSKDDDPELFNLSVTISPIGSGTVSPASGLFEDGESITLTATPNQGYIFSNWSGNASGNTNPLQITITKNMVISAQFDTLDTDGDGIPDIGDFCPDTPPGEDINQFGCSDSQIDMDNDGVANDLDLCPDTAPDSEVDQDGCPILSAKTYVPDDKFEQILIDLGYDNQLNDSVLTQKINTIEYLQLWSDDPINSITDFTGIEDFENLEYLLIANMKFTGDAFDLSQNNRLKTLLLMCTEITDVNLINANLEELTVANNSIDIPGCISKTTNLNLAGATNLKSFNISWSAVVEDLNATLNSAITLEEVQFLINWNLYVSLEQIDFSQNAKLKRVTIIALQAGPDVINIRNGANHLLEKFYLTVVPFEVVWEPCIEADDPAYLEGIITEGGVPNYMITTDCEL